MANRPIDCMKNNNDDRTSMIVSSAYKETLPVNELFEHLPRAFVGRIDGQSVGVREENDW